ncbi:HNH endonuclease [[Mycoplasma] mobile]|uniref:HNH endonuclease n=1 Tax=[Mycoplasma] mobile TaxID=2118 RepID=UPI0002DA4731|nr:HNH endonuclease [[Mycoplasma] mobile]
MSVYEKIEFILNSYYLQKKLHSNSNYQKQQSKIWQLGSDIKIKIETLLKKFEEIKEIEINKEEMYLKKYSEPSGKYKLKLELSLKDGAKVYSHNITPSSNEEASNWTLTQYLNIFISFGLIKGISDSSFLFTSKFFELVENRNIFTNYLIDLLIESSISSSKYQKNLGFSLFISLFRHETKERFEEKFEERFDIFNSYEYFPMKKNIKNIDIFGANFIKTYKVSRELILKSFSLEEIIDKMYNNLLNFKNSVLIKMTNQEELSYQKQEKKIINSLYLKTNKKIENEEISIENIAPEFVKQTVIKLEKENKLRLDFRKKLLERSSKCEILYCKIKDKEILIASHIKSVDQIKNDKNLNHTEASNEISNSNNGFLLCPNHDALFDKHIISFDENYMLITTKEFSKKLKIYNLDVKTPSFKKLEAIKPFLKIHKETFFKKWKQNS